MESTITNNYKSSDAFNRSIAIIHKLHYNDGDDIMIKIIKKVFDKPFEFISLGDASPTETNSEHAQHRRLYRAHVQS